MTLAPLHALDVVYLCSDPGISLGATKGAAHHLRDLGRALGRRARSLHYCVARTDGPEPLPPFPRATFAELLAGAAPRPGLVLERYSLGGRDGRALAQSSGAAHWIEVNAPLADEASVHRGLPPAAAAAARDHFAALVREADGVLCVSPELVQRCIAAGAASDRVHHFPNGFCAERFPRGLDRSAARRALGLAADAFVVAFAGGFRPWHDLALLRGAFERLRATRPEAVLLLIGDGPGGSDAAAAADPTRGVVRLGAVPAARLAETLAAADVGVSPNRADAGGWFCPLKIAEYQAAGLAVVATRTTGGNAPLHDGVTGLLVDEGDGAGLAETLRALAADPRRRLALAQAGEAEAFANHSWERRVERFAELLVATASATESATASRQAVAR